MRLALLLLLACKGKQSPVDDSATIPADDTDATDDSAGPDDSADTQDTGEPDPPADTHDWSACPDALPLDTDDAGRLELPQDAVYCSAWNEERSLEDELAAKSLLRLSAGSYPVPVEEGTFEMALPACTLFGISAPGPALDGMGSTTVSVSVAGGQTYTNLNGSQPLRDGDGAAWTLHHTLLLTGEEGAAPNPLTLDGSLLDDASGGGVALTLTAAGQELYDIAAHSYGACDEPTWTESVHTITFEGGEVALHLRLGDNLTNTAPGSFSLAEGVLDGVAFSITEYFQLIYRPGHHHFSRHFALLFDAPIGAACGLRVEDVDPYAEEPTARVSLTACDLSVIETRANLAQTSE